MEPQSTRSDSCNEHHGEPVCGRTERPSSAGSAEPVPTRTMPAMRRALANFVQRALSPIAGHHGPSSSQRGNEPRAASTAGGSRTKMDHSEDLRPAAPRKRDKRDQVSLAMSRRSRKAN